MRSPWLVLLSLSVLAIAGPAFAQATNPYDVSWSALDPGNDWAAQVLRSIFPIPGGMPGTSTGNEATVIGQIVRQLTGFVAAIAAAFVAYTTIINIHRAAETSRILGNGQSWMFVVRVGFAGIMMFPLGGGFSAGQALVLQGAMVGVGMAKALYASAVQAVGPDALVIAQPMVPGTEQIVSGLIDSELCMDLVTSPPTPPQAAANWSRPRSRSLSRTAMAATPPGATLSPPAANRATRSAAPSLSANPRRTSKPSPASMSTWPRSRRLCSPTFSMARSAARWRAWRRTSGKTSKPRPSSRCKTF